MQKALFDYIEDADNEEELYLHTDVDKGRVVQETSRMAYQEIVSHPFELHGRYFEYLHALEEIGHPATDSEVMSFAGKKDPNYFRPRRNELADANPETSHFHNPLVKCVGKRVCGVSHKTCMTWWFTDIGKQMLASK